MRFFTADLHFGHRGILNYRPGFESLDEMTETIVRRWNETVGPDDEVWILGDLALNSTGLEVVRELAGYKYLIPGNHDSCWEPHGKARTQRGRYERVGLAVMPDLVLASVHGVSDLLWASHLPYRGDHTPEDRFRAERPVDDGRWLLHGHVHGFWKRKGRMINVGVDVWDLRPVSEHTIADVIRNAEEPPTPKGGGSLAAART